MTSLRVIDLKNIFLLLPLLISTHSFSQDQEKSEISDVTRASFFSPGISYEKKIGKLQTAICESIYEYRAFIFLIQVV